MKKQVISAKNTFFHCKLYNELFIFTLKTVNLTVFYSKIT